jgi:hypothetical protein
VWVLVVVDVTGLCVDVCIYVVCVFPWKSRSMGAGAFKSSGWYLYFLGMPTKLYIFLVMLVFFAWHECVISCMFMSRTYVLAISWLYHLYILPRARCVCFLRGSSVYF